MTISEYKRLTHYLGNDAVLIGQTFQYAMENLPPSGSEVLEYHAFELEQLAARIRWVAKRRPKGQEEAPKPVIEHNDPRITPYRSSRNGRLTRVVNG